MHINIEFKTTKGIQSVDTNIEPIIIKDNGEEIVWFNNFKKQFGFSKKLFIEVIEHWCSIRFSKHTTQSYTLWGTLNQIPADFFYPVTVGEPKQKTKYLCKLSDTGVKLIEFLDSVILIPDDYEEFAEQWFKDYLTFLKETK